ncbi:LytTR family DNA-binding domain-containing protein [Aquisalimonas sp.]|uniref:LytR/AlgR family response regulator transcription factor n=1 Tax=unclassified Aquisalimonas TaxID=2644645 RepID=UPI0025BE31A9|nr:LytTR family DNA-binding domain-containing protein [Aquisalimonas sp.]
MRILIVDDEAPARERLARHVADIGDHQVVGTAADGDEAVRMAHSEQPDLVLMDIRMPGTDGVTAARALAEMDAPPAVIFVTAYGEHALAAFDAEAVDYLVKPVRRERLAQALRRARRITRPQLEALAREAPPVQGPREHILCRRRGAMELIPVADVHYFQADNKYVTVCHTGGEDLIEESLRQLEHEFGERFVRIHRNALVARDRLGRLERGLGGRPYLALRGTDFALQVSRRHVSRIRQLLEAMG